MGFGKVRLGEFWVVERSVKVWCRFEGFMGFGEVSVGLGFRVWGSERNFGGFGGSYGF